MIDLGEVTDKSIEYVCTECSARLKVKVSLVVPIGEWQGMKDADRRRHIMNKWRRPKKFFQTHEHCGESALLKSIEKNIEAVDEKLAASLLEANPTFSFKKLRELYKEVKSLEVE